MLVGFYLDPEQKRRMFGEGETGDEIFNIPSAGIDNGRPPGKVYQKRMEAIGRIRMHRSEFMKFQLSSPVIMTRGEREE